MKKTEYYFDYAVVSCSGSNVKYDRCFYTCLSFVQALTCLINDLNIFILQGCTIKILDCKLNERK